MKYTGVIEIVTYKISNFDGQEMELAPCLVHLVASSSIFWDKGHCSLSSVVLAFATGPMSTVFHVLI